MPEGYNYNDFISEISKIENSFNGNTFNSNLDDIAGYDLIFLNYRDGTDDILRNALLLEEVINWVNANKAAGAQQNVVMGISMGGLVSRYCLAKMTKENHNPQTRLLITHDSPHRGANIPLGMQYMLNDFANTRIVGKKLQDWVPLLKQTVNLQLRPATMQQLIVRNNPSNGNLEYNSFLSNNGVYRNMVTFSPSDIQPTYTFIATSQGSQCGVPVLQPSAELVKTSGEAGYTIGFGSFGNKLSGSLIINALPNGTASQRIAYFKLKLTTKILWININTTLLNFSHNSPTGILGYDGAPAGTQPISRGTGIGNIPPTWGSGPWFIPPFIFEYVYKFSGLQLAPEFSFLPTSSALDEDNITATSLYGSHVGATYIPPANLTILQKYIAQEKDNTTGMQLYNLSHTDFTARNSKWIYNEMEKVVEDYECFDYCESNISISGTNQICTSALYKINNLPAGSTVTWSASPSGLVQFSCGSCSQTTVTEQGSGTVTITATINNSCGNFPVIKSNIRVGAPNISSYKVIGAGIVYKDAGYYYSVSSLGVPPPVNINWGVPAGWTILNGQGTKDITVWTGSTGGYVSVDFDNVCGVPTGTYKTVVIGTGGPAPLFTDPSVTKLKVSPNPANSNVTVSLVTDATKMKSAGNPIITEIKIIDKVGIVKKQFLFNNRKSSQLIDISGLPMDGYIVQAFAGNQWLSCQLLVVKN